MNRITNNGARHGNREVLGAGRPNVREIKRGCCGENTNIALSL